jgi:phospholipid/cholesterol/gamma-HCH transport system ATP-binding protein
VLRGVSFNARRGETLVIMGGSGSGKTVTLRLVAGLIRPSSGRVRVFDQWIEDLGEEALLPIRASHGLRLSGGRAVRLADGSRERGVSPARAHQPA